MWKFRATAINLIAALACVSAASGDVVVDFEDLSLSTNSFNNNSNGFTSRGAGFNNDFTDFGGGITAWSGWSYSNVQDPVTPSFTNQYASITGGGFGGGGNYGVAFTFAANDSYINLPNQNAPVSMRVTNTTYTYFTIRDGDAFGFSSPFGGPTGTRPDYYKLTIIGYDGLNATGASVGTAIDFYLADYRFANSASDYIVNTWELIDLSGLVGARSLGFALESSDTDPVFGINTPAYFAIDNLILSDGTTAVPEPGAWVLALTGIVVFWARTRRHL